VNNYSSTPDLGVARNAAGVLEINSGSAGAYRDLTIRNLIASGGCVFLDDFTVGTLPTASSNTFGQAIVTDANAPSVGATVASGGSADCVVTSNGTNWIVTALL
jgi:hypothetical protein